MKLALQEDIALPGFEDVLVAAQIREDTPLETVRGVLEQNFPLEPVMGMFDGLRALLDRFRGRVLVQELPEITQRVTWMEFHVPTNGTGSLSTSHSVTSEQAVEVTLFGSGFGRGRKLGFSFVDSTDSRSDCAAYVIYVKLKPKIYRVGDGTTVVLDVVGMEGEGSYPFAPCPYCGILPAQIDRFDNKLEPYLDLRKETAARDRSYEVAKTTDQDMKIGISIPSLETPLNLSVKMSMNVTWKVEYAFKPGLLYQPYRRLSGVPTQTPMWAVE